MLGSMPLSSSDTYMLFTRDEGKLKGTSQESLTHVPRLRLYQEQRHFQDINYEYIGYTVSGGACVGVWVRVLFV